MVPQQGGQSAFVAELGYFTRTDAAFRADDQEDFAGPGAGAGLLRFKDSPQRPHGIFMQDDGQVRRLHGRGQPRRFDGGPHLGNPGTTCLLCGCGHG